MTKGPLVHNSISVQTTLHLFALCEIKIYVYLLEAVANLRNVALSANCVFFLNMNFPVDT